MGTLCEFYVDETSTLIARVNNVGAIPPIGARIQIRRVDYEVTMMEWTVDHSDGTVCDRCLRVNIWCRRL